MTFIQLLTGIVLMLLWAGRPILYKPAAKYFPLKMSPAFASSWSLTGILISFPLLGHLLTDHFKEIIFSPFMLIALYKGCSLFYLIKLQQFINKKSTSSMVFLNFIALALAALTNNVFFNEGLGCLKVCAILGFGILGFIFLRLGDAKRLSSKQKIAFVFTAVVVASYTVSDHLALPKLGWYPYLLFTSLFLFITSLLHGISKKDFKNIFKNKTLAYAGILYTVCEFFLMYASLNILPVTVASLFLRLSIPLVMIYSSLRYHEQSLKNQLTFSLIAIALALPIILIKS